jgi:hypothetical protein
MFVARKPRAGPGDLAVTRAACGRRLRFRVGSVGTGLAERSIDVRSSAMSESGNDYRPTVDDVDLGEAGDEA